VKILQSKVPVSVPRIEGGIFTTRRPNANHLMETRDLNRTEGHLDEVSVLLKTYAKYITLSIVLTLLCGLL